MLTQLPREILASILQYHRFIGSLWACGDHELHLRLSSAALSVTIIHIPLATFALPSWLFELSNLKDLELRSTDRLVKEYMKCNDLIRRLPNTLETLTINSSDSAHSFANWADKVEGQPLDYYPVASFFPNLKSLALKGTSGPQTGFMSVLPPTLTSLVIESGYLVNPFFAQLPRSLTYLDANVTLGASSKSNDRSVCLAHLNALAQAPPGLRLNKILLGISDVLPEDVHLLSKVPSVLELTLDGYIPAMVPFLPRSLVKLIVAGGKRQSLSSLSSESPTPLDWPPSLQELAVSFKAFSQDLLVSLPRTLLRLTLRFHNDGREARIPFHCDELPPHLQELKISPQNSHNLQFSGQFPSTLTHLTMADPIMNAQNLCASLPDSIESLTLTIPSDIRTRTTPYGYTFPPNLRTLNVSLWRTDWMSEIPPQVTNLRIGTLYNAIAKYDLFSSLPRGLTSFKSEKLESTGALVASYKVDQLPSLLHLTLPNALKLTPASIKRLPRTLRTLVVTVDGLENNSNDRSDVKFLVHLPPHLEQCEVFPTGFPAHYAEEYWPPSLWRCLLPDSFRNLKIHEIRQRLASGSPPPSSNWFTSIVDSIFK